MNDYSEDIIESKNNNIKKINNNTWLSAWSDPVANIYTFQNCIKLVDLYGDFDDKLIIADQERKLKIYKGTSLISEHTLLDFPCAIASYYSDKSSPHIPALAVGSGNFVYIYRNLRPYYKFVLPNVELKNIEIETWANLSAGNVALEQAVNVLTEARDNGTFLSSRSMDLISLPDIQLQQELVNSTKSIPLVQHTVVTCIETVCKDTEDSKGICSLVVGTEHGEVLILEPSGTAISKRIVVSNSAPAFIASQGLLDVDYRIVVATRSGNIYSIKNGKVQGNPIELETMPCGLLIIDKHLIVGCMDNVVHSFHVKGKKNYSIYLPAAILCMTVMELKLSKNIKCLLVSLANGEVRVYNGKLLINTLKVDDPVVAMQFGRYGREDSTLALVYF